MGRSFLSLRGNIRYISIAAFGLLCIAVGIYIATGFNFTGGTIAEVAPSQSPYPVVKNAQGDYESPFVAVAENVQGAVVNIVSERITGGGRTDDFFWHFFDIPREPSTSSGSGFFFRADGYILTNYHVVRNGEKITVRTATGYMYDATLVGGDPMTDLAVLKVEPEEDIAYIPFGNSSDINVGDWAIAIGNPFPQQGLDRTVTVGVISAKGRSNLRFGEGTPRYQDYIQTDASINPGNSGGPLLNLRGEAIGVNSAISSPTGASVGIGFAIPINLARAIVPDLIETGSVSRGWLGVYLRNVNEKMARENQLSAVRGVYIESVFEDSPAERAGIKAGDILLEFNDKEIIDSDQFSVLISTAPKGEEAQINLVRDGKRMTVTPEIMGQKEYTREHSELFDQPNQPVVWAGMELVTYTQNIAKQIGAEYFPGVYINRVGRGSKAYKSGIMPGSIITQVNNQEVGNLVDLQLAVEEVQGRKKSIPLLLVDPTGSIEYKALQP